MSSVKKERYAISKELTDKYYKTDILQLEKLIEKDLSHWL